jgi:glucokinase
VAGGIAGRILSRLSNGIFLEAFRDKGRYREPLSSMPLHVVTNPQVGLAGAVAAAARLASRPSST